MKTYFLSILILFICVEASACPDLRGIYIGVCQTTFAGTHLNRRVGFGISQKDCNKFLFNEADFTGDPRYFIDGQSTLYQINSRSSLRRASVFDNGKSIVLSETVKDEDVLIENFHILHLMADGSLSIESETFDMAAGKSFSSTKCTSLIKN